MAWIQFSVADGVIQAVTSDRVSDFELALQGRAQLEVSDDINPLEHRVDVATFPPRLVKVA